MNIKRKPSISAFFPAYNDAGTIASMVISAMLVLEQLTDDYEIIVVNDGSVDHTPEILDRLAADYPQVRIVHHAKNRGYGGALRSGFKHATKDLIFYTDGDAQYDVRDLLKLYEHLTDKVDVVQGYKVGRSDHWIRKIIGTVYCKTVKFLFNLKLQDIDCDFRLIRRRVFKKVELTHDSGIICLELVKKIQDHGFVVVQQGVGHYPRVYGRSQFFRPKHLLRTAKGLFDLWVELVLRKKHLVAELAPAEVHERA
jgi:glycosyltransferase involved in cell wall biosynthesis